MRDLWFPATESKNVVGRFIDVEGVDAAASREKGEEVKIMRPALESKVTGSHDIACQLVKPFNAKELKARFPGAWDHYETVKGTAAPEPEIPVIRQTIPGTPLTKADFLPRDRIGWLMDQGIQTIEQIRDLTDGQVQNMGQGVSKWRRSAREFLQRT